VLGGLSVPRRGSVRVAGVDPARSPEVRARLGLVLGAEPPFPARTLGDAVRQVLALRGDATDPMELLARHGLGSVAGASPETAGAQIRRQVAWALALAIREPHGLVIHEPLSLGRSGREHTLKELLERAEAGVPVLAVTASPREASELGGSVVLLDRGRFVRRPAAPLATELTPGASATLLVRTPEARALARALLGDPAVSSLEWDEPADADEIRVRGADADSLSLAVLSHARAVGAQLRSLEAVLPALEEVRAATAGIWRAAYENAFRTATTQAREREEASARQRARSAPPPPAPEAAAPVPPTPPASPGSDGGAGP
jgi:ABC-type nitrate/sulfonate/bicarbonate transport system ATPase subunit